MFRQAVRLAVNGHNGLEVVAEAGDGRMAVAEAERTRPNVAIVDWDLPTVDGVRTTCLISERVPECRILLLADSRDQDVLAGSLQCGASAFVTKDNPLEYLVEACHAICRGETLVPPAMLSTLLDGLMRRRRLQDDAVQLATRLTPREREVAVLIARGASTRGIADGLVITVETARTHIQRVLTKLGVHTRLELAALLNESGLLDALVAERPEGAARLHTRQGRRPPADGTSEERLPSPS
jgi:DNA-binding NarL/FixJ family response regulator